MTKDSPTVIEQLPDKRGRIELRRVCDGDRDEPLATLSGHRLSVPAAALRASPIGTGDDQLSHPTDRAVVAAGTDCDLARDHGLPGWRMVRELPFEPGRGFHAVLGHTDGRHVISVKGTPRRCCPGAWDCVTPPVPAPCRTPTTTRSPPRSPDWRAADTGSWRSPNGPRPQETSSTSIGWHDWSSSACCAWPTPSVPPPRPRYVGCAAPESTWSCSPLPSARAGRLDDQLRRRHRGHRRRRAHHPTAGRAGRRSATYPTVTRSSPPLRLHAAPRRTSTTTVETRRSHRKVKAMNELLMLALIQLLGAAFVASIARLAKTTAPNSGD